MSWPLDLRACALQDPLHAWKAVARLSAWMASDLPSGLSIRVRPVCLAWIPSARGEAVEVVACRSWNEYCLLTPMFRRQRQMAATKVTFLDDLSEIWKTATKGSREPDASQGRPGSFPQVALAEAGQGHRVPQR